MRACLCGRAALLKRFRNERPLDVCLARGTFNAHPYVMATMAEFLRRLEPVLIDLANQPPDAGIGTSAGLRDYLDKTDLLFEVRTTKARIDPAGSHRIVD